MKVTLFLGAGFSAPFGHPVMNRFLEFADACPMLSLEDKLFLGSLVLASRRANSFLESSPTNIEDILSFSVMGERLALPDQGDGSAARLRHILYTVYTYHPDVRQYEAALARAWAFMRLGKLNERESLAIITTNYDLNIEATFARTSIPLDPGFEFKRAADRKTWINQTKCYSAEGVPLLKLHGSVNWYSAKEGNELVVEDRTASTLDSEGRTVRMPIPTIAGYVSPGPPEIVPPAFLKPDLNPSLRLVWQRAARELSLTTVLIFVGYSFPSSDTEMMYFLARALMDNSGIRAVYIIDPNAEFIVDRLRSDKSRTGSHLRELLSPIPREWNLAGLPLPNAKDSWP